MSDKLNKLRAVRGALHSLHMTHAAYPRTQVADYCAHNEHAADMDARYADMRQQLRHNAPGYDPYNATLGLRPVTGWQS
jgi:hypothetical protein